MVETAFSEQQYAESYAPGVEQSFWHLARNALIRRWLIRSGMSKEYLLEIGSGRGIIVSFLRNRGIDCIGCDIAQAPVPPELTHAVFPETDFRDLVPELRQRIEGVLLCDVLEHLPEQGSLLACLPGNFPKLKHVLITVPARSELWSAWDEQYGHFRRYTLKTLKREIEQAGFTQLGGRYFFNALYVPARLLRKKRHTTFNPPAKLMLHRIVAAGFDLESRFMPPQFPGTSIIAVCSRVTKTTQDID